MNIRIRRLLSAAGVLAMLAVLPAGVYAETGSGSSADGNSVKEMAASNASEKRSASEIKDRLEKRKTELKIKLSTTESDRIKGKCRPAQVVVTTHGDNLGSKVGTRTKSYAELVTKLNALVEKLKSKGADITQIQANIIALQAKIGVFNTDLATYKDTLVDLKGVDCAADPTAFQAALVTSRAAHDKLVVDAADIKAYVKDTVKPTLQTLKAGLEATEKKTTTTTGSN